MRNRAVFLRVGQCPFECTQGAALFGDSGGSQRYTFIQITVKHFNIPSAFKPKNRASCSVREAYEGIGSTNIELFCWVNSKKTNGRAQGLYICLYGSSTARLR